MMRAREMRVARWCPSCGQGDYGKAAEAAAWQLAKYIADDAGVTLSGQPPAGRIRNTGARGGNLGLLVRARFDRALLVIASLSSRGGGRRGGGSGGSGLLWFLLGMLADSAGRRSGGGSGGWGGGGFGGGGGGDGGGFGGIWRRQQRRRRRFRRLVAGDERNGFEMLSTETKLTELLNRLKEFAAATSNASFCLGSAAAR